MEPLKPPGGFRHYSMETVARLRFIKRAQRLGFTLKEISELLALGDGHCADVRELAEQKRRLIDTQIADLSSMRDILDQLVEACRADGGQHSCAIVEALADRAGKIS